MGANMNEINGIRRVRMEIIFSQALEEDFQQEFAERKVGLHFTKIPSVMGAGYGNPRLGDSVWPQLNTMYIIYCDRDEAAELKSIVKKLREKYPTECVGCFISEAEEF